MRINVSEPELCGCDTCIQHRTLCSQETEPSNVIASSVTSVPVSSEPVQALGSTSDQSSSPIRSETATPLAPPVTNSVNSEPAQSIESTIFKFPPAVTPVSSGSMQSSAFGLGASATSAVNVSSPVSFAPPVISPAPVQALGTTTTSTTSIPSTFGQMQGPSFGSGATATSASSTSSPFDAPSPLRCGGSMQANGPNTFCTPFSFSPAQDSGKTASAFPPPFSSGLARPVVVGVSPTAPFGGNRFSSPFGSVLNPGFGVRYHFNRFEPTTKPASGSRYPSYAPTPDLADSGGQDKLIMSISASSFHGHKSHEELRWEDYKKGDKGEFGWFPPAHTSPFSAPTVSPPPLFASPSIPDHPQRTNIFPTQGNMIGPRFGYTIPTHEPAGISSPASGCTACGATSSSSPSGHHLGLNGATNPPSSATTLPGLFFSTSGSCPMMFGTTTPTVHAYPMMFGTNLAAQGTATFLPVEPYPMMFGTPNLGAQGTTTTPAAQHYPMMFGTSNLGAQGITPAAQAYPVHGLILLPFAAMNLQ